MTNKEILIKRIIYRSTHRGTKEMDLLLGNFVKNNINNFTITELQELNEILSIDDETIANWYFKKKLDNSIPKNKVSIKLKSFKL